MNHDPPSADAPPPDTPSPDLLSRHDPYAALRTRDYRRFLFGGTMASLGLQMQKVAVGWELAQRIDDPRLAAMAIGWCGLVQMLPVFLLAVPAGYLIDRLNRQRVILFAAALLLSGCLGLAAASHWHLGLWTVYASLLLEGMGRSFYQPARAAILPQIVSLAEFPNAVTWNTGGFHLASILGPLVAGALISVTNDQSLTAAPQQALAVYLATSLGLATLMIQIARIKPRAVPPTADRFSWESIAAGARFVLRTRVILGSISLDMLAVLLGGATALLPLYAKEILHVGANGLGLMTAAPAVGALAMSFVLAHRRPLARAGLAMLWSVAGFGLAMIVFGLSRWFWLSLAMLFLTGALDNISVVVRHTLVQLLTPDQLRGRVSAINSMFIGASNELGAFESGLVARLFGLVPSVVSGGIGTLLVVWGIGGVFPEIRRYGRLGSVPPEEPQPEIENPAVEPA